ncbi:hypothetical protein PSAC2689_10597 [Paraburkholderia sacchari]
MAIESSVLDEWYPVAVIEDVKPGVIFRAVCPPGSSAPGGTFV